MRTLLSEKPTGRVGRYPKYTFQSKELPFTAVPIVCAPVLPGETLNSFLLESRVISDPILNSHIGWKKQYYAYFVRASDLALTALEDMFVDPTNTDLSATLGEAANSTPWYVAKGGVNWRKKATEKIIQHWFRDADETMATAVTADGYPIVQIREKTWMDSLTDKDDMPEGAALATATDAGDLERVMLAMEHMRALGLSNMSYHDLLRTYGIAVPEPEEQKPRELFKWSDFIYPANTVDPATGVPASALSAVPKWVERKPFMFKEFGFVVVLSVTRPKVYFSGLAGGLEAHLTRAWDWVPNYMDMAPQTSLKNFAGDTGPLGDRTTAPDGYWADMRDLFIHGDQFQNVVPFAAVPANTGANHMLALPTGDTFNWKYPTETMCKSFFKTAGSEYIRQDGYCSLGITGRQVDMTQAKIAVA